MTELYIDNQPVVLPKDFSLTIVNENLFFTKNGKYTYDITLSLLEPVNAKIYKHYNRLNNSTGIVSKRPARLIADNDVILNGTEIILEITDANVKTQLVSGESELNYFIGGDKKLNELEFGNVDIVQKSSHYNNASKIQIDKVLDSFNQTIDSENKQDYSNANIGYDLSDDEYFKYQNLSLGILELAGEPIHKASYEVIDTYMNDSNTDKIALKGQIFIADDTNTWYIAWLLDDEITYMPKKVNIFRPIKNNPDRHNQFCSII
jgi:hypothetical protein